MISIIIPVYNHWKELEKCLESIAKQTYKDFEVIIVDDGSEMANSTEQIANGGLITKFIRQENKGAPAARNRGFRESRGEYLLFCDADVVMRPKMLEKMIKALETRPEVSYAYSSFKWGWKTFKLWPFDSDELKKHNYIHSTSLIRREHFPGWDESIKRLQDWDLWLTMLEQGHKGVWIPEILFKVKPRRLGMSKWRPRFLAKFDSRLKNTEEVVKKKHRL